MLNKARDSEKVNILKDMKKEWYRGWLSAASFYEFMDESDDMNKCYAQLIKDNESFLQRSINFIKNIFHV